jgi:hypothetical protein
MLVIILSTSRRAFFYHIVLSTCVHLIQKKKWGGKQLINGTSDLGDKKKMHAIVTPELSKRPALLTK